MGREVSESCVDSLLTEIVSMYCNRLYANKPELAASRIDAIGYQVGHQLSERYTMERPRFTGHLDAIKFICKDFWSELFKKQIDNLKTNHRLDPSENGELSQENAEAAEEPNMHLHLSCGVIKGALHNLGIACVVSADTSHLPACSFVVRIKAPMDASPRNFQKRVGVYFIGLLRFVIFLLSLVYKFFYFDFRI